LTAHFGGVLVGVEAGEEMHCVVRQPDDCVYTGAREAGFVDTDHIAHEDAQSRLGAIIDAFDIARAAEGGDPDGDFARRVGVAPL